MFWNIDLTPEEIEEVIHSTYRKISDYKMETVAILTLESIKPWSFVGGELIRADLSPFMPAFGEDLGLTSEKMLQVYEDRKNIERLIQLLEENLKKEEAERRRKKEEAKEKKRLEKERGDAVKKALKEAEKKKGWFFRR
jgi:hypothetical protein